MLRNGSIAMPWVCKLSDEESKPWFSAVAMEFCWYLIHARLALRVEKFHLTELQVPGTSRSQRTRRTSVHGGSNYTKLEFPSNRKWTGKKVAFPSISEIQLETLSSWLLQHYGVVVGSLSEGGGDAATQCLVAA